MRRIYIYPLLFLILSIVACKSEKGNDETPLHLSILDMQKDLSIPVGSLGAVVGTVTDLAVDRDNNIYLEDPRLAKIHVLSSAGKYLTSLGRRGHGPGEFEYLNYNGIFIYNDTLYAIDNALKRLTIFRLDNRQLIRTLNFPDLTYKNQSIGIPSMVRPLPEDHYEVIFKGYSYAPDPKIIVSILDHNLIPLDTVVMEFPPSQFMVYLFPSRGYKEIMPFRKGKNLMPKTLLSLGPNGLLYEAITDNLHIKVYNQTGKKIKDISGKYTAPTLTRDDLDSLASGVPAKSRALFYRALDQNNVIAPGYWQVLQKLLVDDKGRCWVELVNPGKPQQTWWVFDTDGKPKWKFQLSAKVQLYVARNGEAYGIWREKGDYPKIVRYRIKMNPSER